MSIDYSTLRAHKLEVWLQCAKDGIATFPCLVGTKRPATPNGFKNFTTDLGQIEAWYREDPSYNIAAPTGAIKGFDVVDIDKQHDGDQSWGALLEAHVELREVRTPFVMTPGGGVHLYFRHAEGVTTSRGSLPRGIDVRGSGGYVLLPPSVVDGKAYRWGQPFDLDALPLAGLSLEARFGAAGRSPVR